MEASRVLRLDPLAPDPEALAQALAALESGYPIIVPTETVYGVACLPDVPGAVERVYEAKGRPESKPLPRMVADVAAVQRLVTNWPDAADKLAKAFWPGPLTMILSVEEGTLAFRIPDQPVLLELLRRCKTPLAVTSANVSGGPETQTAEAALKSLQGRVTLALDAGPARLGVASTIVDCTKPDCPILREGGLTRQQIAAALNSPE